MARSLLLPVLTLSWWMGSIARADNLPPDAAVFHEFAGPRSVGMGGAHRGLGTSNDTLYLNPAGMSAVSRYTVELNYAYDVRDELSHFNVSAVDSKSGPVAGAIGYTHVRGDADGVDPTLHRIYAAAAYPLGDFLVVGVSAKNIRGTLKENEAERDISLYTGDVGLLLRLGGAVGLGVAAHNVVITDYTRMTPLTFSAGAAYASGPLSVAADFVIDARDTEQTQQSYHAGAEFFLANQFPIRAGYRRAPFTTRDGDLQSENVISGGVGWVSQTGALAVSAERSVERTQKWLLVGSLQVFL